MSNRNYHLTLVYRAGCPLEQELHALLERLKVPFEKIEQTGIPVSDPLRKFSSPTLLQDRERILVGGRMDGEGACTLKLPSDSEVEGMLQKVQTSVQYDGGKFMTEKKDQEET